MALTKQVRVLLDLNEVNPNDLVPDSSFVYGATFTPWTLNDGANISSSSSPHRTGHCQLTSDGRVGFEKDGSAESGWFNVAAGRSYDLGSYLYDNLLVWGVFRISYWNGSGWTEVGNWPAPEVGSGWVWHDWGSFIPTVSSTRIRVEADIVPNRNTTARVDWVKVTPTSHSSPWFIFFTGWLRVVNAILSVMGLDPVVVRYGWLDSISMTGSELTDVVLTVERTDEPIGETPAADGASIFPR